MFERDSLTGELSFDGISLRAIADQYGTPCYVYSRSAIEQQLTELNAAFGGYPHSICYAVKANSNIALLNVLANLGAGFDIVSAGELFRVIQAGGDPAKVVFSGVAKSDADLTYALNVGVGCINIESMSELERVQNVAKRLDKVVNIGLRINPDIDPETHPYISTGLNTAKFGIAIRHALTAYQAAHKASHLKVHSIACHIGSQITKTSPFRDALEKVLTLVDELAHHDIHIAQLDLGGGLGIRYKDEQPPSMQSYVHTLLSELSAHKCSLPVTLEPGRSIVGNAGVLLTRVEYLKHSASDVPEQDKRFCIVDAGMNDLLRPALYQAHHEILNVGDQRQNTIRCDVVGPVCETADVLAKDRELAVEAGDLLAIQSTGAYGFVMASNYNSRPKPAEVMISNNSAYCIRQRETLKDLTRLESLIPNNET